MKNKEIKKRMKILFGFTFLVLILLIAAIIFKYILPAIGVYIPSHSYSVEKVYEKNGLKYYEDGNYKSLAGIDVSIYQGNIDWNRVKASGVDFAIIRTGYRTRDKGEIFEDTKFKENIEGAAKAGLDVGVYFFSQAITKKEAREEANFVTELVSEYNLKYPVVFDMEYVDEKDRIRKITAEDRTEIALEFCKFIESKGLEPMIYGNPTWLGKSVNLAKISKYEIWLADYSDFTDFPYDFKIWQYTQEGKIDGIKGYVDLNIHFVEDKELL